jgi:hypothetical protein
LPFQSERDDGHGHRLLLLLLLLDQHLLRHLSGLLRDLMLSGLLCCLCGGLLLLNLLLLQRLMLSCGFLLILKQLAQPY